jgi:hypothetical protein
LAAAGVDLAQGGLPVFGTPLPIAIAEFGFPSEQFFPAELPTYDFTKWRIQMKLGLAVIATAALIGTALPACAEEVGVGVGPVGVTVGDGHRDRDVVREREVVRERDDHRDRDTVIIKKGDHDRDVDHDRRKVIIDHN